MLGDRVVYSATLAACFAMGTFIGLTIYVPIFLEGVLGYTASESGVALIPLMVGTVTGATLSGRSMIYFKHYKRRAAWSPWGSASPAAPSWRSRPARCRSRRWRCCSC